MGKLTIIMKIGFVWAIMSFLSGCALIQNLKYSTIESQNKKIEQQTAKLKKYKQANLALKEANKTLKTDKSRLMNTNSKLKKSNVELATKIDMLKTLDHRVEEKRENYSSD